MSRLRSNAFGRGKEQQAAILTACSTTLMNCTTLQCDTFVKTNDGEFRNKAKDTCSPFQGHTRALTSRYAQGSFNSIENVVLSVY